jgi:hypothetical protein
MDKFQGCKFIKITFCLYEKFEFELTTTVKNGMFCYPFCSTIGPFYTMPKCNVYDYQIVVVYAIYD